jgi:DNA invertase Pin-like site-specific DNA recombinase
VAVKKQSARDGVRIVKHDGGHSQLLGYARVSTKSQSLDAQIKRLREAGCCRIYCEQISGGSTIRPAFTALLDDVRKGDSVVVMALDRLGRRASELLLTLDAFRDLGVHFRDLRSGVDTRSPHGRILLGFLAAIAEAERTMATERIREGLAASDAKSGRPKLINPTKVALAVKLHREGLSTRAIGHELHLSQTTVRKMLALRERENPRQLRLTE